MPAFDGYHRRTPPAPDPELTRVGPGTPGGEYLRRFWQPVAFVRDLATPLRVRIMGEDLVVFRDRGGRHGVLHLHCAHRGTSLEYGIPLERGIRCCYHGWVYDVDGRCLETPGEPPGSRLCEKVWQGAYPTHEFCGLVFAYLGPPEHRPAFPVYDSYAVEGHRLMPAARFTLPCNWLQVKDNSMDPVHTAFLHALSSGYQFTSAFGVVPELDWQPTPSGMVYIATRRLGDLVWVRVCDYLPPNVHQFTREIEEATAEKPPSRPVIIRWAVPNDDTTTTNYELAQVDPAWGLTAEQVAQPGFGQSDDRPYAERQRFPADFDAQSSQRTIAVHALEHLGSTDRGVIMLRKIVRDGIRAVARGEDPWGVQWREGEVVPTFTQDVVLTVPPAATEDEDRRLLRDTGRGTAMFRRFVMPVLLLLLAGCATAPSRPADLADVGVSDAAQLIRAKTVTSAELTRVFVMRAAAARELNAFITLDREGALAAAQRADAELAAGRVKGPLHGVPLVVKDNIHVAGLPNTAGTPGLRDFKPAANAPTVQKLLDAGAVILGKTNMHELAFGISGYNEAFHTAQPIGTRNPYDRTRIAGGSSSGTGAAIGGRLAPGGLGSDTGGSVRIPAALTGGAGLRPTLGRYSQEGVTPIAHSRDTVGPMARTVADVALLDSVIAGGSVPSPASLRGVRLGVYRGYYWADLDADTNSVMDTALTRLRQAGVTIVEVDMPDLKKLNDAASFPVALYEAYDDLKAYLAKYQTGKTVEQIAAAIVSKDVKGTYDGLVVPRKLPAPSGPPVDAAPIYQAAMRDARPALAQHFADAFAKNTIDALLAPTTPAVAVKQGPEASSLETFLRFIRNTDPGSNAGIPGLTIPAGFGPTTGLPVGVSLDGPRGSDARLLALGMAIESLLAPAR